MPHEIDVYVGKRLRQRRFECGLSQAVLGEKAGITFQQIQKYERGANRIAASRLYEFSKILNTEFQWFVEGLDDDCAVENIVTPEISRLIKIYNDTPQHLRKSVMALLQAISKTKQ